MSSSQKHVLLERILLAAGWRDDPAEVAQKLRAAGVPVTRNSRAQWVVSRADPAVQDWLRGLALGKALYPESAPEPEPEPAPVPMPAPGLATRGTGRHVFPDEVAS